MIDHIVSNPEDHSCLLPLSLTLHAAHWWDDGGIFFFHSLLYMESTYHNLAADAVNPG